MEYTFDGAGKFPALSWQGPEDVKDTVKEWLLVTEDPDAPLPTPIAHGFVVTSVVPCIFVLLNSWSRIYGGIPPTKTAVAAADFEIADESRALLKGGFHYGVTRRGIPYIAPRPLMNHGPHRCTS